MLFTFISIIVESNLADFLLGNCVFYGENKIRTICVLIKLYWFLQLGAGMVGALAQSFTAYYQRLCPTAQQSTSNLAHAFDVRVFEKGLCAWCKSCIFCAFSKYNIFFFLSNTYVFFSFSALGVKMSNRGLVYNILTNPQAFQTNGFREKKVFLT